MSNTLGLLIRINSVVKCQKRTWCHTSELTRKYLDTVYNEPKVKDHLPPRTEMESAFFTKTGPGYKLITEFEKFKKAIGLPKFMIELYKANNSKEENEFQQVIAKLKTNFEEDLQYIFPGFFKLIVFLRKIKKEFAIILRSKQMRSDEFIREVNYFFNGDHPFYNGKNGTQMMKMDNGKGGKNYIIKSENMAVGHFMADEFGQAKLVVKLEKEGNEILSKETESFEEAFVRIDENLKKVN